MLFWLAGNTICQEGRKSEKQKDVGLPVSFLSWFRVQRVDQTQHANSAGAGPTCAGSSQRNGSGGVAVGLSSQSRPSVITCMSRCADAAPTELDSRTGVERDDKHLWAIRLLGDGFEPAQAFGVGVRGALEILDVPQ